MTPAMRSPAPAPIF